MQLTRVCPSCKWEFPHTYVSVRCKFCRTIFDQQWCPRCKEFKSNDLFYYHKVSGERGSYCNPCKNVASKKHEAANPEMKKARNRRAYDKMNDAVEQQFKDWRDRVATLPFKILSEQQWLAACEHFGGCAVCGDDHIETRQYFVPFQQGGKYTAWNIFPMCGKCSTVMRRRPNPFRHMSKFFASDGMYIPEDRAKKLLDYLELQIEKVTNNEQKTDGV